MERVREAWDRRRHVAAAVAGLAVGLAALGSVIGAAASPSHVRPRAGSGTVTFALEAGLNPNYIFPITPGAEYGVGNLTDFQPLMFRSLYWIGSGTKLVPNPKLSLAYPPRFLDGNRAVQITLRPYRWSDGTPVTARDAQFFFNLLRANKNQWGGYVTGDFPDFITKFTIDSSRTFTLTFNRSYAPSWLANNELPIIVPLPQQAWDKTSARAPVANYDLTTKGAQKVYTYLSRQSSSLATYGTNPLWQVVDGPFRLLSFNASTSYTVLVPNRQYAGPVKPRIAKLIELPFTSNSAEFDALRAGEVDYGYIPYSDLSLRPSLTRHGDRVQPWPGVGINYVVLNYTNKRMAPYFKQLYIRQALQLLVNQPLWIRTILKGYGYPDYGPVPVQPKSPYLSRYEQDNPYPYDPARAGRLLAAHGWKVVKNGTSTCIRPGRAATDCGAGIKRGAPLAFTVVYSSGTVQFGQEMEAWKSSATAIGLTLNLSAVPFNTVITIANPCTKGPTCTWDLAMWGGWSFGTPYPTGGQLLSPINAGGYRDPVNTANIRATHISSNPRAMFIYENYVARTLPFINWVNIPTQISVIVKQLRGVVQNAVSALAPEYWSVRS
ncbi:MAG TPA: ABC transporter substrate-binding protein [Candidatus Micrarchaeia archaeon]|nr:ABC transporter substrate-binding protein [Candidatus Micrarchaeia archaeon]